MNRREFLSKLGLLGVVAPIIKLLPKVAPISATDGESEIAFTDDGGDSWMTVYPEQGTTWYVSPNGDDNNDGLTPSTAFAGLRRAVNACDPCDYVVCLDSDSSMKSISSGFI